MSLVERNIDGQNFIGPSYDCTYTGANEGTKMALDF